MLISSLLLLLLSSTACTAQTTAPVGSTASPSSPSCTPLEISGKVALLASGSSAGGVLGVGDGRAVVEGVDVPLSLRGGETVVDVAVGVVHSVLLTSEGRVFTTGKGSNGELGRGVGVTQSWRFQEVATFLQNGGVVALPKIRSICVGRAHSCVLTDSFSILCSGDNTNHQLAKSAQWKNLFLFEKIVDNFAGLSCGAEAVFAIDRGGVLWVWGSLLESQGDVVWRVYDTPTQSRVAAVGVSELSMGVLLGHNAEGVFFVNSALSVVHRHNTSSTIATTATARSALYLQANHAPQSILLHSAVPSVATVHGVPQDVSLCAGTHYSLFWNVCGELYEGGGGGSGGGGGVSGGNETHAVWVRGGVVGAFCGAHASVLVVV